jgi:hypothetical protein
MKQSPCFGRHVEPLVPVTFAVTLTVFPKIVDIRQAAGLKISWRIFVTTWRKLVPTHLLERVK